MVNIIAAEGIRRVGDAESVKIFVGGLPQKPEPPLNYQIVYSLEGALDYYTTPSWVLREGRPERVDALSELEDVKFRACLTIRPRPVLEADPDLGLTLEQEHGLMRIAQEAVHNAVRHGGGAPANPRP